MKKLARFSIVLLSLLLMFSCLTDPVEIPKDETTPSPVEPDIKPDENLDQKPTLKLDPCDDIPDWFSGQKWSVISGWDIINGVKTIVDEPFYYLPELSLEKLPITPESTGKAEEIENGTKKNYYLKSDTEKIVDDGNGKLVKVVDTIILKLEREGNHCTFEFRSSSFIEGYGEHLIEEYKYSMVLANI